MLDILNFGSFYGINKKKLKQVFDTYLRGRAFSFSLPIKVVDGNLNTLSISTSSVKLISISKCVNTIWVNNLLY